MTTVLLVAQFVLAIILTIAVLLQKSSSIGLGAYSGSNESLFGAKGPAGFLAMFTFVMAGLFILNTLALGYIYNKAEKSSLAEQIQKVVPPSAEKNTKNAPKAPAAPKVVVPAKPTSDTPKKDTNTSK